MTVGKKQLISEIRFLFDGEYFELNAIHLTTPAIKTLRKMIELKFVIPVQSEAQKRYKEVDDVMSGKVILPQMVYFRSNIPYYKVMGELKQVR